MSYGNKLAAIFGSSALAVTALAGCMSYLDSRQAEAATSIPANTNLKPAQSFSAVTNEAQASNGQAEAIDHPDGEITASEFALTADDSEIAFFEEENGFSFDRPNGFEGEQQGEFSLDPSFNESNEPNPDRPRSGSNWYADMNAGEAYDMAERTIGIPADLLKKIVNNESLGDVGAVNPDTGACGLGQLMPETTLPEMAYKYSETLGFDLHTKVDHYIAGQTSSGLNVIGYRPHRGERGYLRAQCLNEWVNVSLFSMNIVEKMRRVDTALASRGRHVNYVETDIYVAHFLGARADIIWARRNNPDALARNFVNNRTIRQNRHMFFDHNNRPRSVAGMYAYAEKDGAGPSEKRRVSNFWRTPATTVASRVQLAFNAG